MVNYSSMKSNLLLLCMIVRSWQKLVFMGHYMAFRSVSTYQPSLLNVNRTRSRLITNSIASASNVAETELVLNFLSYHEKAIKTL